MIVIGIPTYNEADNISTLTKLVDNSATALSANIKIINADNNSDDKTSEIFKQTKTKCPKISLTTQEPGKGYSVKKIIDYVSNHKEITYCMLLDGDVTSFNTEWLQNHINASELSADYVVPNYARYLQEGNTTNHFIYPILYHLTSGNAPRQGIAGDFGLSFRFIKYLAGITWPKSAFGYGVDIFLTMQALFNNMNVQEITLSYKIHKPSFNKMINMFYEVAESYYTTRLIINTGSKINFTQSANSHYTPLLNGQGISDKELTSRYNSALSLLKNNESSGLSIIGRLESKELSSDQWSHILAKHEQNMNKFKPSELAKSITPFYLLRVITYLRNTTNVREAEAEITRTTEQLNKKLSVA